MRLFQPSLAETFKTSRESTTSSWSESADTDTKDALTQFWIDDGLQNIIPSGTNPSGYDEVGFLRQLYRLIGASSVVDVGCGYGRLAPAFPQERYLGLDINHEAIAKARSEVGGYEFREIDFDGLYPAGDLCLAYTVLLHIDDEHVRTIARHISESFQKLLIVEIMQRQLRALPSQVPNYCRNRSDYEQLFAAFALEWEIRKPYRHYQAERLEMSYVLLCKQD